MDSGSFRAYPVQKRVNKPLSIGSLFLSCGSTCDFFLGVDEDAGLPAVSGSPDPRFFLTGRLMVFCAGRSSIPSLIFSVAPRVPTTRFLIKLHWLSIKARIEFKICLIVFKALRFGQPKYIADMLSPPVTISHLTLRSDDDPYHLHEPRAVDERAFAERSFVYTAPRLYNGLPATVKQLASVQSFKIHSKTFLFSRAYNSDTNTINEVYKL